MLRFAPLLVLCLLAPSCSCGDESTRNEAMLFLDRFEDIDVDDPLEERRTAIASVHDLALTDPAVVAARDECVHAHQALIDAEDQHALARHLLVEAGGTTETDIPTEAAARINAAIDTSDEAIARSRELFPRCSRAVSQLEHRFPRHASH